MLENTPTPAGFRGKDLIGQKFVRTTVVGFAGTTKDGHSKWNCLCDCGTYHEALGTNLGRSTKSCGCLRRENKTAFKHGHAFNGKISKTYTTWALMWQRCVDPNTDAYPYYGGVGIMPCDKWRSFAKFLEDMGEKPPGLTLERIDPKLGYYKENCIWATWAEQTLNKRSSVKLTFNGKTQNLCLWARELGMRVGTLWKRLKDGWSIEKALTFPVRKRIKQSS